MKTRAFRSASLLIVVLVASLAPLSAQPAASRKDNWVPTWATSQQLVRVLPQGRGGGTGTSRDEPDTAGFRATDSDADRSADDAHADDSNPGDSDAVGTDTISGCTNPAAGAFTAGADVHQSDGSDDPALEHRRTSGTREAGQRVQRHSRSRLARPTSRHETRTLASSLARIAP